jgi:hypothetical protein
MATVASSERSVNDVHYALLRHPPSVPLVLMASRVDVILLVVGTLHMTSRFSLLAPYPTERLDVILHQKKCNNYNGVMSSLWKHYYTKVLS